MRASFSVALVMLTLLVSYSAALPVSTVAVWQDVSPNAYLNPYENPPLDSVFMFPASPSSPSSSAIGLTTAVTGWAVGNFTPTVNETTGLPSIFHFDGSVWSLVPAPRFPDFPSTPCGYSLSSVNFGQPNNASDNKNDGWAVGFSIGASRSLTCGVSAGTSVAIHWDGSTWRVQVAGLTGPDAGQLFSVFMVSPTDVWAVGQNASTSPIPGHGTIWHWTGVPGLGGGWNLVQKTPFILHSIFMVNANEGWAVGDQGEVFHYFGGAWTPFSSPVSTRLWSVFMVSPTEGWATGDDGMIVHYSSGTWSGPVAPGTTTSSLFSVFMISSTEGWAVGGNPGQIDATIVHYSGGTWTALPINLIPLSPVNRFSLNAVFLTTAADGWAVGTAGVITHFDGVNWGTLTSPSLNNFTSVNFGPPLSGPWDPNNGWIVGNASEGEPTIFHWNGFMWTKGIAIGTTNNLNSVFMVSTQDVWTVGGGQNSTATCTATPIALCPVILHFTGGAWNTVTPPPGSYTLKSVFMVSATEGWAVGEQATSPNPTGVILHYTASGGVASWSIFPAPSSPSPTPPLNSVDMLNENEGWAVGDNATLLHYTVSGGVGTWNTVVVSGSPTLSTDANLTSVFMLSPTDGWAVGGIQAAGSYSAGPVIIHWDGTHWTPVATPSIPGGFTSTGHTSATLKTIFCQASNNCWAAGLPGILYANLIHWDGVQWVHVSTIPALLGQIPPILTSIYLTSANSGWIVGSDPEFPGFLPQSFGGTTALSTILRAFPSQTVTTTATSSVTATATATATVQIVTPATSFQPPPTATTTPVVIPPPPENNLPVWFIIALALVALVLILVPLLLLLRRRRPPPPPVLIPIRRPAY